MPNRDGTGPNGQQGEKTGRRKRQRSKFMKKQEQRRGDSANQCRFRNQGASGERSK